MGPGMATDWAPTAVSASAARAVLLLAAALLCTSAGPPAAPPLSCLQMHNYTGPAIKPRHLSLYERWAGYGELCCIAERSMFSAMMQMLQYAIP
jgi:hypothetical protein